MAPETRSKKAVRAQAIQEDIIHLLEEVWDYSPEDTFYKIFKREARKGINYIINLEKEDLKELSWKEGDVVDHLTKGEIGLIRMVEHYKNHLITTGQFPSEASIFRYNTITQESWINFVEHPNAKKLLLSTGDLTRNPPPGLGLPPNFRNSQTPAETFKKSIKRDATLFPTFKDGKFWDNWRRSTLAVARAQDVEEVLNHDYIPLTDPEIDLFTEKKKFMYSVFTSVLQTDRGKKYVREHEADFNAQAVYKKLVDFYTTSTKASINAADTLSYITTAKIENWKGTSESFVLHWQDQIRLYETLSASTKHLDDSLKLTLLQNSVHSNTYLRAVKDQADQLKSYNSSNELNYDQYCALLLSAANNYDSQFVSNQTKNPRRVYTSNIIDYDFHQDSPSEVTEDFEYDIDAPVSTLLANLTNRNNPNSNSYLPSEDFNSLTPQAKEAWRTLPNDLKAVLIKGRNSNPSKPSSNNSTNNSSNSSYKPVKPPSYTKKPFTKANLHELITALISESSEHDSDTTNKNEGLQQDDDTTMLVNSTTAKAINPGDIRKLMSTPNPNPNTNTNNQSSKKVICKSEIVIDGETYRKVNTCITYQISQANKSSLYSLVDRGANGGVAGNDVRVIEKHSDKTCNIKGIDNHEVPSIPIVTAGGVTSTISGEVIIIMHQYAYHPKCPTIHSSAQIEHYKNVVDDRSIKVGGSQHITTLDNYKIPISIKSGLPYIPLRPYTDTEWETLPHVILTSDVDWDPTSLDCEGEISNEVWFDAQSSFPDGPHDKIFDEVGNYRHLSSQELYYFDAETYLEPNLEDVIETFVVCNNITTKTNEPQYELMRPLFNWLPLNVIKKTFQLSTQYGRTPASAIMKKTYRSPFPALNVKRRSEPVATDTVYADTPAIDNGSTCAQVFVGTKTFVSDVYGMKSDKQFVNSLQDNIRKRGAMDKLISDRAKAETSSRVNDILRALFIDDWQSEPYMQHQNKCENRYQTIKRQTNTLLDRTGAPPFTWLLAMTYVCFILNHTYNETLKNIPINAATGSTCDISPLLRFHFWQPIYFNAEDKGFPSTTTETLGRFVGISENVGHAMTFKIFNPATNKVIDRSNVRAADEPNLINHRADHLTVPEVVSSLHGEPPPTLKEESIATVPSTQRALPIIDPSDLVGRTFLLDKEDGQRLRARVVKAIDDYEGDLARDSSRLKFVCTMQDDTIEEIFSYNELLDFLNKSEDEDDLIEWRFKSITGHEGPLPKSHPNYNGSPYNLRIEWENGEITNEPLNIIAADDPVSCAIYGRDNDLLDKPSWKRFKSLAKREKKLLRALNQAKLRSYRTTPRYKFGYEIPRNNDYDHALSIDKKNRNNKWSEAIHLEVQQQHEYDTYKDLGHKNHASIPKDYKKIRAHFVFDVKHDGRHKARLVADGHLTEVPLSSVYSGVVSLRGIRLVLFLAELNGLEEWGTDIGNAYLEAFTKEKVYIVAGPEFGDLQGHILIILKALYGLRTSGLRWHERLADCLRDMGYEPCKMEPDIWLRECSDHYEYIAVYVDDLLIASKDPNNIISILTTKYKFKLKGTGPISYHLGCNFDRDENGTLCFAPRKYIEKMEDSFVNMFGSKPKQIYASPLEKGDHPELDTSEYLDQDSTQKYQSLIGAIQWAVSLGRLDVNTAVATLASFRAEPRKGHLERAKRVVGYLVKFRHATIRFRTEEPDMSSIPTTSYDWEESVYGKVSELLPEDAPEPKGKHVVTISYHDANLYHNVITGRSVTGVLHFINKTPIDWYSKRQATIETATYGSEYSSARTCVEQILDLRITLRYLGVPIRSTSYMFGDNKSVVDSSMTPHGKIHKRHVALSFHRVRESIAAKVVSYHFIDGKSNPADILSKHWAHHDVWSLLKAILFWPGDTMECLDDNSN